MLRSFRSVAVAVVSLSLFTTAVIAAPVYSLKVQIVQVCDNTGTICAPLGPTGLAGDLGYLYQTQVEEIFSTQTPICDIEWDIIQWNSPASLQLDSIEQASLYNNSIGPAAPADSLQFFVVNDHPGTGYDPANNPGGGWVANPLANPNTMARNAGNAQLGIVPPLITNRRGVMANEGFTSNSLSGTLAHEIAHGLGLRHVNTPPLDPMNPATNDPVVTIPSTTTNLMWGGDSANGPGPMYDGALSLAANFTITAAQSAAMVENGTNANLNVLQVKAVPEPSAFVFLGCVALLFMRRASTLHQDD